MQNDLISREEAIAALRGFGDRNISAKTAAEVIKNIPTAYDLEKVTKRLSEYYIFNKICASAFPGSRMSKRFKQRAEAYEKAICIVRSGGKEQL